MGVNKRKNMLSVCESIMDTKGFLKAQVENKGPKHIWVPKTNKWYTCMWTWEETTLVLRQWLFTTYDRR